jgi:hypothetical protein
MKCIMMQLSCVIGDGLMRNLYCDVGGFSFFFNGNWTNLFC